MTTPEERDRLARELEVRKLVPDRAEQMAIRAAATRVAREASHLEGEERERSVALEARFRQLELMARRWPDDDD